MKTCIGWDVGGAHLKAVLLDAQGRVLAVKQLYCPLWQGLSHLESAVQEVITDWQASKHAVTMTGELADIFPNRKYGVEQIVAVMSGLLHGEVLYFSGKQGLTAAATAKAAWEEVASANWLASARFVAQHTKNALFVDIGSTTTDILLIHEGRPMMQGDTDAARMQCDELVYTGVVRTPLMAVAQKIMVNGKLSHVAAEYFATTADVYTLTGDLRLEDNLAASADGADKSEQSCAARIARMVGYDVNEALLADWKKLALEFKQHQIGQIQIAMQHQLSRLSDVTELKIIGAGTGSFLVKEIARDLNYSYQDVHDFVIAHTLDLRKMAAVCFPAYAVGFLALGVH